MAREKPGFFTAALRNAALLALFGALLGALVNALRSPSLPWTPDWDPRVSMEMRAREEKIPLVYLPELKEIVSSGTQSPVDARPADEYAAGHVPGAASLPVDSPEDVFSAFSLSHPLDDSLVVYCRNAECGDALDLCRILRDRGWSGVRLYPGGFEEWTGYGGEVEPPPAAGTPEASP